MKIAYFVPSLDAKGPIFVVKSLSDLLINKGHEIIIYYFDDKKKINFNCKTEKISIDQKIDFDYFDILHSHCLRPDIYLSKWKSHIKKAKIISTLHQDTYQSFKYDYNVLLAKLFTIYWCHIQSKFDMVISISNQLRNLYNQKIKTELVTIYNGCEIQLNNDYKSEYTNIISQKKNEGYNIIGTYAYVTKRKGLDQIIKALPILENCIFVIIGDGPEIMNLKALAKKLSVDKRVIFVPHQDKPYNYLSYIDVYVMPSYSEGFGLAMVEAAFAKKAIICSDLPSFHEIFPNGEALFFKFNNALSLKDQISESLDNKEKFGNSAFNRVNNCFRTDIMADHYEFLYRKLIQR